MPPRPSVPARAGALLGVLGLALAGCSASAPSAGGGVLVSSSDTGCELSTGSAPAGPVRFEVSNTGDGVTEFYLLAQDALRVLGEVADIGPGVSRDLTVELEGGSYVAACKPGMTGDGIRTPFTVTGSASTRPTVAAVALDQATTSYEAYVRDQTGALVAATGEFAAAYRAGDDDRARALYAPARVRWERIEPVAESFGDLDPKLDAREGDVEMGTPWIGWHRIE